MNQNSDILSFFRIIAVTGNILMVLWILSNGVNEGFVGTTLEVISYIALMALLLLNSFLIFTRRTKT